MFPTRFKNRHCRNYEPIDFESGFCHFHQKIVLAEGDTCQYFDRFPRCQNCKFYTSSVAGYLGTCQAWPSAPMTFPDMLSATCDHFTWQTR